MALYLSDALIEEHLAEIRAAPDYRERRSSPPPSASPSPAIAPKASRSIAASAARNSTPSA
jgi:hypothetical protein